MTERIIDVKNFHTGTIARIHLTTDEQGNGDIDIRTKEDNGSWADGVNLTGLRLDKVGLIAFAQFATRLIGVEIEIAVNDYLTRFLS